MLDDLRNLGFTADVLVQDNGSLCCRTCGHCVAPADMDLMELRRLEGASDPADMAAVLGLRCAGCGALGSAIVRFGPEASEADGIVLEAMPDHRRD